MPKIAKVVVGLPVEGPFDYFIPAEWQGTLLAGERVNVSFGRRPRIGFVVGLMDKSNFPRLNPILAVLDQHSVLDDKALSLTKKISEYYGCSWGQAIETYLPDALRKRTTTEGGNPSSSPETALKSRYIKKDFVLLHSLDHDKGWSYLSEQIRNVLAEDRSVIILVPEVFLMDQLFPRLNQLSDSPVCLMDKRLTSKQEVEHWMRIKKGEYRIVLGTRSAVFAPVVNLGLIIICDEENTAYQQEQSPSYHVHQVARIRQAIEGCRVIHVSSAPLAETWEKAKKEKWEKVFIEKEKQSLIQIVDMTNYNPQKTSILSFPLQNKIQQVLQNKGKVILFMNRRGFSTMTRCHQCGFTLKCPRCETNLAYLFSKKRMVCGHCRFEMELPKICPQCRGAYLRSTGTGVERLESEASRFFPTARIRHYDQETKGLPGDSDIIIATQAIIKYRHELKVALTAVIQFDSQLNHIDFRSAQKAFTLLTHLSEMTSKEMVIQTYMYEMYCLKTFRKMDFNGFYRQELKGRKQLGFPPYQHLIAVSVRGPKEDAVFEQSKVIYEKLKKTILGKMDVLDPHPDVVPKLRDKYRYVIVLKGPTIPLMLNIIKSLLKDIRRKQGIIVTINVDP